jgi:hypothetical protein
MGTKFRQRHIALGVVGVLLAYSFADAATLEHVMAIPAVVFLILGCWHLWLSFSETAPRFSLRQLLILTTLVAIIFGIAATVSRLR